MKAFYTPDQADMNKVDVIGMGQSRSDLTALHLSLIHRADLLVGGLRHLAMFPDFMGNTFAIKADIPAVIGKIKSAMDTQQVVVLASGDPMFHGIGSTLARHFPLEQLRIYPNISAIGAAFSAICQPWQDAKLVSLHSKAGDGFIFQSLKCETKVAFLTGPTKDPVYIGKQLIQNRIDGFRVCVLENLGHPEKEKISWFNDYDRLISGEFSHPNIVILLRDVSGQNIPAQLIVPHETHPGLPDETFRHSRGLITKSEIRALSLAKLRLTHKAHVLWDIGAGSGSVGVEAALQLPWGDVYAVEKNKDRISDIQYNVQQFQLSNVKVLNLDFPVGSEILRDPDRIFVGGGGKGLDKIIDCCCQRINPHGIIVVNTVVMESMHAAIGRLKTNGFKTEMIQVQVSRSKPMPYGNRLDALNPVWIISARKERIQAID